MSKEYEAVARTVVRDLTQSKVREIANAGFGKEDLLRFWFGESNLLTPPHIRRAAAEALTAGRTFYTHNNGNAELRSELAEYLTRLHRRPFETPQITVTSSGVSALMIAMQAILDPGDRVVVVTPVWPNVVEIPRILGADVVRFGLVPNGEGWTLDIDRFLNSITPATRLVLINSPNNPTGWTLTTEERQAILQRCRRLGVWLIGDDVYERLFFDDSLESAPSFLEISEPDDRVMGVNSFSKAWLMTGWRLGWIVAPPRMETDLGKLVEYNTSCAPDFVQAGGLAAITDGDPHVAQLRSDLIAKRDQIVDGLRRLNGVNAPLPNGGMYAFFSIDGFPDSVELAKQLIAEAGLGLAPGIAFGPEGEGWLRWCFAADESAINKGLNRLADWLNKRIQRQCDH